MVEPHSSNFRVIRTNFLGVRIFRKFTVNRRILIEYSFKTNVNVTVDFLNIRTPEKFVVITLKFELCGSTIEY